MKQKVNLKSRSYEVCIGSNQTPELAKFIDAKSYRKVFVISDRKLMAARKTVLGALKKTKAEVYEIAVTAGESLKEQLSVNRLYRELIAKGADRRSVVVALGGGSVGDAVGFVASTYMRGIDWIGVPTTLLAQVDSSIGGKTAINHPLGKNLIGTFHQPVLVVCDSDLLKTLSNREMISGLGEVAKYALVYDRWLHRFLVENIAHLLDRDQVTVETVISRSVYWKSRAVAKDERDLTGVREILNFGHTFGHALESFTKFKKYQHGEAVILGMRFALALSLQRGVLDRSSYESLDKFLADIYTPILPAQVSFQAIFKHMKKDKKSIEGRVRFILLKRLAKPILDHQVHESYLRAAYSIFVKALKLRSKTQ